MNDRSRFVPLSVREQGRTADWDVLHEGVPVHLTPSLRAAVMHALTDSEGSGLSERVQRLLRLDLPPITRERSTTALLLSWAHDEPVRYLDVADCLLHITQQLFFIRAERDYMGDEWDPRAGKVKLAVNYVIELRRGLDEADSAYEVDIADTRNHPWRLVRRVNATATTALHDAVQLAENSSSLLAGAWAAAFQRKPDFAAAYRYAVLAVESVACPVLTPNDREPTLGKAITHLRDTAGQWTVAGLDAKSQSGIVLLGMLQTVWQNHGRHVEQGGRGPEPVRQEQAEAVLFLAITLVQWFERGLVTKVPRPG